MKQILLFLTLFILSLSDTVGQDFYNIDQVNNQAISLSGGATSLYDQGGPDGNYVEAVFRDSVYFYVSGDPIAAAINLTFNTVNPEGNLIDVDGAGSCNWHGIIIYDAFGIEVGTFCNSDQPQQTYTIFGGGVSIVAYSDGLGGSFAGFDILIESAVEENNHVGPFTFGGSDEDLGRGMIKTEDGNYFISGTTRSDDGDVPYTGSDSRKSWAIKIDKDGNKLWATDKTEDGSYTNAVKEMASGYLLSDEQNIYKYNKESGALLSIYTTEINSSVAGSAFAATDDGGAIAAISRRYGDDFDPYFTKMNSQLEPEIFIERPSLSIEWGSRITHIERDVNGDYVCIGEKQQINSGCTAGCATFSINASQGSSGCPDRDIWILRLSASFQVLSSHVFGSDADDGIYSGALDENGDIFLLGSSYASDYTGPCSSYGPDGLGNENTRWITKLNRSSSVLATYYSNELGDGKILAGYGDQLILTGWDVTIYSKTDLSYVKTAEESYFLNPAQTVIDGNQEDCFAMAGTTVFFLLQDEKKPSSRNAEFDDFSFVRSVCEEVDGDRCSEAIALSCGITAYGSTVGQSSDFDISDYTCYSSTSAFDGGDVVYYIDKALNTGYLNATLYHGTSASNNLSLFLLDECGEQIACLQKGVNITSNQVVFGEWAQDNPDPLPAGRYYFVVDGANTSVSSDFSLTVTCSNIQELSGTSISCGEVLENESNAFGTNNQSIYYGNNGQYDNASVGNIAPERVYAFNLSLNQSVTITLDDFDEDEDFELYLAYADCPNTVLSPEFCIIASSTNPAGTAETIERDLQPGQYLIIVDGYRKLGSLDPTIGTYDLSITGCDAPQEVVFHIGDKCGNVGTIVDIPITTSNFDDILSFMFEIDIPVSANYEIIGTANHNPLFSDIGIYSVFPSDHTGTITWFDGNFEPRSVVDGTRLFDLQVLIKSHFEGDIAISGSNAFIDSPTNVVASVTQGSVCSVNVLELSGQITDEEGTPAPDVLIQLIGQSSKTTISDQNGYYTFTDLEAGSYEIFCSFDGPLDQGVDVADLVRVRGHFLNIIELDSDYKLIAADVRRDESINVIDVSNILGISLNKLQELQGNTSWRFVPQVLNISADPLALDLANSIEIDANVSTDGLDFIAIKVGDVTNDALQLQDEISTESRSSADWALIFPDIEAEPQTTVDFVIEQEGITDITSIGFDMIYDTSNLHAISITSSLPGFSDANYLIEGGTIKVVWVDPLLQPQDLEGDSIFVILFEIDERADESTDILAMNVKATDSQLVERDVDIIPGSISFNSTAVLDQKPTDILISPNPFSDFVRVTLPEEWSSDETEIIIIDVAGRVVKRLSIDHQTTRIHRGELPSSGVYYFGITNGTYRIVKKVIMI